MATDKIQNKNISRLSLCVGQSWSGAKINNKPINSIFMDIDNGDGIIQDNELVILNKSYDLRRKISPEEAFSKINYADYTKDELIKRYPPSKYTVEESKKDDTSTIVITDKKTGNKVLEVTSKHGENKSTVIEENDSDGKLIMRRCYDDEGKLNCYDDSQNIEHHPIADLLYKDVSAKNSFGLPTTDPRIEEHAKLITPKEVIKILDNYEQRFGESLENAIKGERGLDKEIKSRILKHITKCLEMAYNYDRNFKNENSVISNEYHKGNTYSLTQNGDEIIINNKSKNRTTKLNLEKLTTHLHIHQKVKMKVLLQNLPGEILEDIADEDIQNIMTYDLSYAVNKNSTDKKAELIKIENGYLKGNNNIVFDNTSSFDSLISKVGLSLNYAGNNYENSTIDKNELFLEAFEKEWNAYKNDGHSGNKDTKDIFSKCYTLLMTGTCEDKEIMDKYFKNTLAEANNHIYRIRQMTSYNRRASKA